MPLPLIIIMAHGYSHALNTIDACWVYYVESVSKIGLVLSISFLQYMGLHVLNWPVCLQITPSHYHHYADSSEGIELLTCLSSICCRVCV